MGITFAPPWPQAPYRARGLDRSDKRDALLRAAIDTFAARGFFNAQVADVARAAGVAAGTVYLYFRSKDDLLISIFERTMQEAIADGRRSVGALTDPVERLREIARLHLGRLGRDRASRWSFRSTRQSTKFMGASPRPSCVSTRHHQNVIADGRERAPSLGQPDARRPSVSRPRRDGDRWILSRRDARSRRKPTPSWTCSSADSGNA
jgi:AcrR family transcriptional regulator